MSLTEASESRSSLSSYYSTLPIVATSNPAEELRNKFGLEFDKEDGILRQLEPDYFFEKNAFNFDNYSGDDDRNKWRYEEIGFLVDRTIYSFLEKKGLRRIPVPKDTEKQSFFFASREFKESEKLMVLIHGAGVVQSGQWARREILNDNLECGSQLPFVDFALEMGFGVVIINTNYNFGVNLGEEIPDDFDPVKHALNVWSENVAPSKARDIVVVALNFGGIVTLELAWKFQSDFGSRVFNVEYTNFVHSGSQLKQEPQSLAPMLHKFGLYYVMSDDPFSAGKIFRKFIRLVI